jgi:hypothetical protein
MTARAAKILQQRDLFFRARAGPMAVGEHPKLGQPLQLRVGAPQLKSSRSEIQTPTAPAIDSKPSSR